ADAVTMRRISTAIGVTPMAIYRHYPNRAALINSLADEGFDALASLLSDGRYTGGSEERLIRLFDVFLGFALENPRLFELMFLKPRSGARRYPSDFKAGASPTASPVAALVREGMRAGELRRDDAWEITFEMGAMVQGLIMLHLGNRTSLSRTQFRSLCLRALRRYFHGICN
ncbi:MAG TPA: TetR/AcrR family transcriptional regulator, partial [Terracidiphilus sp.]|nr:TetR/AcrR family transcriptional regulator [Terracidiphilus sp.]